MAINTWSNRIEDFLFDIRLFCEPFDCSFVFVSNFNDVFITESSNIVCLNNCVEDRESMLNIGSIIKFVDENTCDFNLISRSSSIYEIVKNENFFLSWDSTRRN
jgi:hypothetical protein